MSERSRRPTVYLETSAFNSVFDAMRNRSRATKALATEYEILFSSCNLDEFGGAKRYRAVELASFAWKATNRQKLLDHIEIMATEIDRHLASGAPPADYVDRSDPGFPTAWQMMRENTTPELAEKAVQAYMRTAKEAFRDHGAVARRVFSSARKNHGDLGHLTPDWPVFLKELEEDAFPQQVMVQQLIEVCPEVRLKASADEIMNVDYRLLPSTAVGLQYFFALEYRASFESGRQNSPDLGDQVDVRHAYYAGIADYFVSDDRNCRRILSEDVEVRTSEVLSATEFLDLAESH